MLWTIIAILIILILGKRVCDMYSWHPWTNMQIKAREHKIKNKPRRPNPMDFVDIDTKSDKAWKK